MDDTQQMIVNELRRIERAIEKRTKALSQARARSGVRTAARRYVLEYPFEPAVSALGALDRDRLQTVSQSFIVDRDCQHFRCQQLVFSVTAVGTIDGVTSSNSLTLAPPGYGLRVFEFDWAVRDTATDRQWQNAPLPAIFMGGGLTAGKSLAWPAKLRGGTEVEVTVTPTYSADEVLAFMNDVSAYKLQIAMVGYEVL